MLVILDEGKRQVYEFMATVNSKQYTVSSHCRIDSLHDMTETDIPYC